MFKRRRTGLVKKIPIGDLRAMMTKELNLVWKELCEGNMMHSSFADVELSLNIDDSEDHKMKFQGQSEKKTSDIII